MKSVLLVTFLNNRKSVSSVLKLVASNFEVIGNRVFLLKDVDAENKYVLSYNIVNDSGIVFSDILRNTIPLHRKKDTNTLYTVNALNELVILQNDGELDSEFPVNWDDYKDCILLTNLTPCDDDEEAVEGDVILRKINTKLVKVFNLHK